MFKKNKNLFESVISDFEQLSIKVDKTYLSPECKERFLTPSDIPELIDQEFHMAGISDLKDGYVIERASPIVHTLLFTLAGEGQLTTQKSKFPLAPNSLTILPAETSFRFELPEKSQSNHWKMIWVLLPNTPKWDSLVQFGQSIVLFRECEQLWSLLVLLHSEIGGRATYRKLLVSEISRLMTGLEVKTSPSTMRVQTLFNQVEAQLHLPWTIKEMAVQCFISEEQLN